METEASHSRIWQNIQENDNAKQLCSLMKRKQGEIGFIRTDAMW